MIPRGTITPRCFTAAGRSFYPGQKRRAGKNVGAPLTQERRTPYNGTEND